MSMPSMPRQSAAIPPIRLPMIWPMARNTEYRPMIAPRSAGKRSDMSASRPSAAGVAPGQHEQADRGDDDRGDQHDQRQAGRGG